LKEQELIDITSSDEEGPAKSLQRAPVHTPEPVRISIIKNAPIKQIQPQPPQQQQQV